MVGIYTNPNHVMEYSDGEVRQQFSICFRGRTSAVNPHRATNPPRCVGLPAMSLTSCRSTPRCDSVSIMDMSGGSEPYIG